MDNLQTIAAHAEPLAKRFAIALGEQRKSANRLFESHRQRLEQAVAFIQEQLHDLEQEIAAARKESEQLRAERDNLAEHLAATKKELDETRNHESSESESVVYASSDADLNRRYKMAMTDLREANKKNTDLQQQLTKTRSSAAKLAQQTRSPGWLDWESEKQRILTALEEDECETEEQNTERMATNEVLRITDKVIAVKNHEIQELKRLLEDGGTKPPENPVEDPAVKQLLNNDAVIQEERQRLQDLQKDWLEKLRTSEIELSLERAKIARERAELDEQARAAKETLSNSGDAKDDETEEERPARGRWLSHFGLTAADREPSRRG